MTCCFTPICQWFKNWFLVHEKEIEDEFVVIANKIVPIILPLIRQELENIIDTKYPQFKTITDEIINEVL